MELTKKGLDGGGMLNLEGEWTVERAAELKAVLLEALSARDRVVLNLERVAAADVSILQLLCAAHRSALKQGKPFGVSGTRSEELRRVAGAAGYARTAGCRKGSTQGCLWIEGASE